MAKGDCTITKVFTAKPEWGGLKKAYFEATLDNYKTGGYTFDLTAYGLGTLRMVNLPPTVVGFVPEYDATNKKLLMYWVDTSVDGAPLAQAADNDATLNAKVVKFSVEGVGV